MKKQVLIVILNFLTFIITNAQIYTIYGTVSDKYSGEQLIGAAIFLENQSTGTITNNYGFYSLKVPEGKQPIICSFLGYNLFKESIYINKDTILNISLEISTTSIDEVVIKSESLKTSVTNLEISTNKIDLKTIKSIPIVFGETDIIKTLQLLPGIQTSHEGTTNLSIRGGSSDQNLILLDEAPIYNPSHALGFV